MRPQTLLVWCRQGVKSPLAIGDVQLVDGSTVKGFVGESYGIEDCTDISHFGGWRVYLAQRPAAHQQRAQAM